MALNPIALAVPFFLLLIGGELWLARRRGLSLYRLHDAVTDMACGMTQQITLVFFGALWLAGYAFIYDRHRLFTPPSAAAWAIAFVGVDFFYYWWHRASHEVNLLWAAHVTHHQSEDYNLAVALRQSIFSRWTELPFMLPLALLGVPPVVFATMLALSELYQFWIHTQLVGKSRGLLDRVLNLPSHHRVHHAINPRYLDKNYAAVLIVWDRLFGTYEEESEPPVYGITHPLATFNPIWAQIHYCIELAQAAWRAPRLVDKVQLWFRSPAWSPSGMAKPPLAEVTPASFRKYDPKVTSLVKGYVLVHFVLVLAAVFALMMWQGRMAPQLAAALGALALVGLLTFGALLDGRRWAWPAEVARLTAGAFAFAWFALF